MEVINFINDLRKKGSQYYSIWLPIILQFHKEENVIIKINAPIGVPKTTYHRIINYGVSAFAKHVKLYILTKSRNGFILNKNEANYQEFLKKFEQPKQPIKIEKELLISDEELIFEKPNLTRKKVNESSYPNEVYEEIIGFLNQSTGKNYKNKSLTNRKLITSRLNDGFTVEDFKQVISVKSINWLGGKMEQFLRPETLFSNKFESYLNENIISNVPNSNLKNTYDQITLATELYNSQ